MKLCWLILWQEVIIKPYKQSKNVKENTVHCLLIDISNCLLISANNHYNLFLYTQAIILYLPNLRYKHELQGYFYTQPKVNLEQRHVRHHKKYNFEIYNNAYKLFLAVHINYNPLIWKQQIFLYSLQNNLRKSYYQHGTFCTVINFTYDAHLI